MRGISALYCLYCEREGCLSNSRLIDFFRALDTSDECPTSLDLRRNYLGDAGAAALLRTAAVLRWLRVLDLRDSGAGEAAVRALVDVAPAHPDLRLVDLRGAGNAVFAVSGRRLVSLLRRCPRLVVRADTRVLPAAAARRLHALNKLHARQARAERRAETAKAALPSLAAPHAEARLLYLRAADEADPARAALLADLNARIEEYVAAHQHAGRAAAQIAIDLGPAALSCVPMTAAAASAFPPAVRAVGALLRGLRANPSLREELRAARGEMLADCIARLAEMRGEYDALGKARLGAVPSARERRAAARMLPVYARIAAGIAQRPMTDLPSMQHVEGRLREVREHLIQLLEGRERVLPVLLVQARYFVFNHPNETEAWAAGYVQNPLMQPLEPQNAPLSLQYPIDTDEEEEESKEKAEEAEEAQDEEFDDQASTSTMCSTVASDEADAAEKRRHCFVALDELRDLLAEPHTAERYALTHSIIEKLPEEMRLFFCDLALRRGAGLYVPPIFGPPRMAGDANDPPDILGIFARVEGRSDLSDVICAFEEWYRLRQVECYDVTHVSRQELLSRMVQM